MLVIVDRDTIRGLIMQGVKNGIHWRAVQDYSAYSIEGSHKVAAVYLQFFIDATACGITDQSSCITEIPPPYNREVTGAAGMVAGVQSEFYGGMPHHYKMQWIEVYYGKLRQSLLSGTYVGANMIADWYPRKTSTRHLDVLPRTFMKYILPSAQYMCNYLELVADGTAVSMPCG